MLVEPILRVATIPGIHHVNIFFDYAFVEFLQHIAFCIGLWVIYFSLGMLQSKSPEAYCRGCSLLLRKRWMGGVVLVS